MSEVLPDRKQLHNSGFAALLPEGYTPPETRTFVVLGLARGGTTMVAQVLESFGIFMGEGAGNDVREDTLLAEAIESGRRRVVRSIVARYDATHQTWGFKRPNIARQLDKVGVELRNPHFVVVWRDIFAIANRNRISTFKDPLADMRESLTYLDEQLRFVEKNRHHPLFHLSYERVLTNPREFVLALGEFCGVELDDRGIRRTLIAITPGGGEGYLQTSRVDSFLGRVSAVSPTAVRGHFRYHRTEENPPLELYVNGDPVDTELSWSYIDLRRPNGRDFSGDHAFELSITDGRRLQTGDEIDVVADDRRRQRLKNCPYRVRL